MGKMRRQLRLAADRAHLYDCCVRMGTAPDAITRGREYRWFDSGAGGIAAFICSPLAGAILIAVNYFRLGKVGKAVPPSAY